MALSKEKQESLRVGDKLCWGNSTYWGGYQTTSVGVEVVTSDREGWITLIGTDGQFYQATHDSDDLWDSEAAFADQLERWKLFREFMGIVEDMSFQDIRGIPFTLAEIEGMISKVSIWK